MMTNSGDFEDRKPLLQNRQKSIKTQFFAAITAALGGFSMGSVLSYTSPALPSLKKHVLFSEWTLDEISWFASVAPLASLCACACIGLFTERIGRRGTLVLLTVPLVLGWLLIGLGTNLWTLCAGRILSGFSGGAFSVVVPVYINETAGESVRGRLGLLNSVAMPSGMSVTYLAGCFLEYDELAFFLCFAPVLMFVLLLFVAESPRYYLCRGKIQQASKALAWLRGVDDVEEELNLMKATINDNINNAGSCFSIFTDPSIRKPMLTCIGLMFFLVASGIDAVIFFTYQIFESSGTHISPALSSVAVGFVELIAIGLSSFAIDRFGRRPLMLISEGTMAISLGVLGLFFRWSKADPTLVDTWGWIPLVCMTFVAMGFAFGMGPVPYVYLEVIPSHVGGLVAGFAVCFNWSVAFLVTRFFGVLQEEIGSDGTYWLFAGFCCLGGIYILFCVPETKGKTLEEIRSLFQ